MAYNPKLKKTQNRLIKLGYDVGEASADGYYGDDTDNAINAALDDAFGSENDEQTDSNLPDGYITEHFQLSEFICKDGAEVPKSSRKNLELLCTEILEPLRERLGAPIIITSGYRHQKYNDNISSNSGVSKPTKSMHILAAAADISCPKKGYNALMAACEEMYENNKIGGLGTGNGIIHVDIRHLIDFRSPDGLWGKQNSKARWYY